MSGDLALFWDGASADLAIADDDLRTDGGLRTAVMLSLFLDRRAEDDDALPGGDDRRGWWADELAENGDRVGSRLWLLDRSKRLPDIGPRAEALAREALAWMLEDRVAEHIDVMADVSASTLILDVTIHRPNADPIAYRFAHAWGAEVAHG